jgi:hypothetical protein
MMNGCKIERERERKREREKERTPLSTEEVPFMHHAAFSTDFTRRDAAAAAAAEEDFTRSPNRPAASQNLSFLFSRLSQDQNQICTIFLSTKKEVKCVERENGAVFTTLTESRMATNMQRHNCKKSNLRGETSQLNPP